MKRIAIAALIWVMATSLAQAKEELVTLPKRDSVQLTIYNSVDLTFVRERRHISFKKGENTLSFSWAQTLIDPTSVTFKAATGADKLEITDTTYPAYSNEILIWHVSAAEPGDYEIEISYFTSGISWNADYVGYVNGTEDGMELKGYVRVYNVSGEDYDEAEIRLVVGRIHLVEEIAELARRRPEERVKYMQEAEVEMKRGMDKFAGKGGGPPPAPGAPRPKEIVKEGLSEYFIYSVEGTETVPHQWSKRMISLQPKEPIPFENVYKYDVRKYGDSLVHLYKFKNDKEHKLGDEPLPNGALWLFKDLGAGSLAFIGARNLEYIPKGAEVEVNLGPEKEVTLEQKVWEFRKQDLQLDDGGGRVVGWTTVQTNKMELKNFRPRPIHAEIRVVIPGDFDVRSEAASEPVNFDTIEWKWDPAAGATQAWTYTVTTRMGRNARK